MRSTGSPQARPKELHESHQRPGPTSSMPEPCEHACALNASSAREWACWTSSDAMHQLSDIFNFNVKFCQTSFRLPTLTPDINSITSTIIETDSSTVVVRRCPPYAPWEKRSRDGDLRVEAGASTKDTGEYLTGDVEQRDASVIITELPVPLPILEMDDGRVFETLRNLSLVPHLLEECLEFCYQPGTTVLADFRWDYVGSRGFTAGNLLHGPDGFW
ncbi:unnamed protein product [Schistocephalus solidus]|uniref:Uncharacterized protein n=1 Tax=Schistocephalus solidus TaxID=70667 RepID=A0A183SBP9_SCHSO|nr:unnamed protein product [Schistocephalus solidus]